MWFIVDEKTGLRLKVGCFHTKDEALDWIELESDITGSFIVVFDDDVD